MSKLESSPVCPAEMHAVATEKPDPSRATRNMTDDTDAPNATDEEFGLSDDQLEDIMHDVCWSGGRNTRTMTQGSAGTELSVAESNYGLSDTQLDGLTRAFQLLESGAEAKTVDVCLPGFNPQQLQQIQRVRTKVRAFIKLTKASVQDMTTRKLTGTSVDEPDVPDKDFGLSDEQLEEVVQDYCWTGGRNTRSLTQGTGGTELSMADSDFGLSDEQLAGLSRAFQLFDGDAEVEHEDKPLPTYSVQQVEQIRRVHTKIKAVVWLTKARADKRDSPNSNADANLGMDSVARKTGGSNHGLDESALRCGAKKLTMTKTTVKQSLPTKDDIKAEHAALDEAASILVEAKTKLKHADTREMNVVATEKPDESVIRGAAKKLTVVETTVKQCLPTNEDINAEQVAADKAASILTDAKMNLNQTETKVRQTLPTAEEIKAERDAVGNAATSTQKSRRAGAFGRFFDRFGCGKPVADPDVA